MDIKHAAEIWLGGIGLLALFVSLVALPALLILYGTAKIRKHSAEARLKLNSIVIAEYEAPAKLSPAEIGFLFDAKIGKEEWSATILDLVNRGILAQDISDTYHIHGDFTEQYVVRPHEQTIIDQVVAAGVGGTKFGDKPIPAFKKALTLQLINSGYIKGQPFETLILRMGLINLLLAAVFPGTLVFIAKSFSEAILIIFGIGFVASSFPPYWIASFILMLIYSKLVGQTWLFTAQTRKMWPEIIGFREYLKMVEVDQLKYENEDVKIQSRNSARPYLYALGLKS